MARQQEREERARAFARCDPLTGLYNRLRLNETLAEEIMAANATTDEFALFLLDLDRFKPVNDLFGHTAGDQILKQVGGRISEVSVSATCVARIGGDEFAILLRTPNSREEASEFAEGVKSENCWII
jgi:diguanylate cyclase (GGDEF)-like protein